MKMRRMRRQTLRSLAIAAGATLFGLLTVSGCGTNRSPLAQNTNAEAPAAVEAAQGVLTFSAPGLQPSAKRGTRVEGHIVTATIGDAGGYLQVTDDGPDSRDRLVVKLDVPRGALDSDETITMEVFGGRLNELEIHFIADDLVFSRDATLSLKLESDLYSPDELLGLTVEHWDDDGNFIESIDPEVTIDDEGTVSIKIRVPSLSRYALPPGR